MTRARKTYPPEFNAEAVRLVRKDGMGVARVASSLGVDRTLVREWVKKADEAALAGTPAATTVASMADELARLRRENAVLREEREILKKAAVGSDGQRNTGDDVPVHRLGEGQPRSPDDLPCHPRFARSLLRVAKGPGCRRRKRYSASKLQGRCRQRSLYKLKSSLR